MEASAIVWDTIDFHDIAGLVAGAHEGEGLGNRFLANIRETDAIVHVVRAHRDENVIHPEGRVDPLARHRDDRDRARARRPRAGRTAGRACRQTGPGGDRVAIAEEAWLTERDRGAAGGTPGARRAAAGGGAERRSRPGLADEPSRCCSWPTSTRAREEVPAAVAEHAAPHGARAVAVSSRIEAELARSSTTRKRQRCAPSSESAGRSPVARVVREAFALLHLIAFFTAGEAKPAQSWHLRRGLTAWHAAGQIHSDIQKGFVRAEVIGWQRAGATRAATAAPATAARCAWRAATTRWPTAT